VSSSFLFCETRILMADFVFCCFFFFSQVLLFSFSLNYLPLGGLQAPIFSYSLLFCCFLGWHEEAPGLIFCPNIVVVVTISSFC